MTRFSMMASAIVIALVAIPVGSFAQSGGGGGTGGGSAGGAASGPSTGGGSAVGSPSAGSTGAGSAGVSGVPSGPASAGGLNNSLNDPSGAGNSGKVVSQPPPGTNSAGTANSSGSSAAGSSTTTGSAGSRGVSRDADSIHLLPGPAYSLGCSMRCRHSRSRGSSFLADGTGVEWGLNRESAAGRGVRTFRCVRTPRAAGDRLSLRHDPEESEITWIPRSRRLVVDRGLRFGSGTSRAGRGR